ncbi:MAG: hypothetical protein KBS98_00350, partial [Flavobacterium sp.]|nr:hypothetical protein [Candidatus Neoflavobacterium equi]
SILWKYIVEVYCGSILWKYIVEVYCGSIMWKYFVELFCGSILWKYTIEKHRITNNKQQTTNIKNQQEKKISF